MSSAETPGPGPGKAIARFQLEEVIRRAVELSLVEADAEEQLSEQEVVRIATELGLTPRHVLQALYELPELESEPSRFEKYFGPSVLTASRAVPGDAHITLRRLEDYLSTREYQQVVRRRHGKVLFMPADDTISYLARGLLRPRHRFQLARSRRVVLAARPLDSGNTHVQLATDLGEQRRSAVRRGFAAGGIGGVLVGGAAAALATGLQLPEVFGAVAPLAAFAGGFGATISAALRVSGSRFRARMDAARLELDGLLDRAERGDSLEPPAPPWRRRLQLRFGGR